MNRFKVVPFHYHLPHHQQHLSMVDTRLPPLIFSYYLNSKVLNTSSLLLNWYYRWVFSVCSALQLKPQGVLVVIFQIEIT